MTTISIETDLFECQDIATDGEITVPTTLTALDLYCLEEIQDGVPVFHAGLDKLLNGGLGARQLCMISGRPGVGKTTTCLQLCCDVQVSQNDGGAGGQALFISTDAGFTYERLNQIANGFPFVDSDKLLNGVHVLMITGLESTMDTIRSLYQYLTKNPLIRLLVIDSFSLPFICEEHDTLERTKLVHSTLTILENLTKKFNITIVLTIQLTTVLAKGGQEVSKVIPCLGEGLRHRTNIHIMLEEGKMFLLQSCNLPRMSVNFCITNDGIR